MEENNNGQGFWVESNFEPNPNYQPKRRQKAKGGTSKHKAGNSSALSGLNALLPSLTRFFPRLSGIISLGTGIVSLFGGLGKFLKRGCLILVVGIVVIIALLWGLGTCMVIDEDGHQVVLGDIVLQLLLDLHIQEGPVGIEGWIRFLPVRALLVAAPVHLPHGRLFLRGHCVGCVVDVTAVATTITVVLVVILAASTESKGEQEDPPPSPSRQGGEKIPLLAGVAH